MTCHSWIHGTCVNYNGGSVKSKEDKNKWTPVKSKRSKMGAKSIVLVRITTTIMLASSLRKQPSFCEATTGFPAK